MKNLYLISFLGGTAGNFIRELLIRITTASTDDIEFTLNYGAHSDEMKYGIPSTPAYWEESGTSPVYKFFNLSSIDLNRPVNIALDHLPPDWDELFELYPTSKNIIITLPHSMAMRVVGNLFFKTICSDTVKPEDNHAWQQMREIGVFTKYDYPEEVPVDVLEDWSISYASRYNTMIVPPYDGSPIPDKYKDRVCCISYYDIIHDMDKVLNQLKNFIGMELPIGIENVYKQYIDAQTELVKTKMPWVNDK